jgi:hypothetical protein
LKAYKVPEKLKPAVSAETENLQRRGYILPIDSPQASPMICIMKGKSVSDGIRIAIDYRHIIRYTIDTHQVGLLEDTSDFLQKIGKAKWISKLNCQSGYWQPPLTRTSTGSTLLPVMRGNLPGPEHLLV